MLPMGTSHRIIMKVEPIHIFSGDDHDQCEYTHEEGVVEHTVGTFSWMQGMSTPSFGMVTLFHEEKTMSVKICFTPNQLRLYLWYLILLVISIFVLQRNSKQILMPEYRTHAYPKDRRSVQYWIQKVTQTALYVGRRLVIIASVALPLFLLIIFTDM